METDDEQVEKLKAWWKENGRAVIAGIVIGVGGLFGYRGWVDWQETTALKASSHFSQMVRAIESKDGDSLTREANILIADYASSDYAVIARFALTKNYVETGVYDQAIIQLEQIIGSVGDAPLGMLARKRLASVHIQRAAFDAALKVLDVEFSAEFAAAVEELKGDAFAKLGKIDEAANAYRKAQRSLPGPADTQFLQQKLDDLGVNS